MAMTPRERLLALGVGATVGLFGLQYGFTKLRASLDDKQSQAAAAKADLEQAMLIEAAGFSAGNKLNKLKEKSLPSNTETLVAQYRNWLFKLGEEAGLFPIKVGTPELPSQRADSYTAYDFSLAGNCKTDQVVELLGRFYDKDYLHTIKTLKLTQTKNPNEVMVVLDVRALSLKGVDADKKPSEESSGRLAMSIDEYKDTILGRNPFSPPNQPPSIASSKTHEIKRGERWSLALEAKDAENNRVDYQLVSTELPPGLNFSRGRFSWQPEENGEHEVVVKLVDNGWPNAVKEERLTFRVVDPPVEEPKKEEPKFDVATQAFVTAIAGRVSAPQAMLRSRADGKTTYLTEGLDFEIGSIKAKVLSINLRESFIELETDGNRWIVGMDTSLADAYRKSQID